MDLVEAVQGVLVLLVAIYIIGKFLEVLFNIPVPF